MHWNSWNTILSVLASAGFLVGFAIAALRWGHNAIVRGVEERLKTIDAAVNHRKPGQPPLIQMVDLIWEELQRQGTELDEIKQDFAHHLGLHEGMTK
jgi:hypothetical protein